MTVFSADIHEADVMRALGRDLIAPQLRAGDLLILSGPLGAGKTTLVQGIGEGLCVRGAIVSPTFIIARTHPSTVGGPPLIHVDAYRLTSLRELDDLDLDASLSESVTVVEWGADIAEALSDDRLVVTIDRPRGGPADDAATSGGAGVRTVTMLPVGDGWADRDFSESSARIGTVGESP